ncbi:MAG: tetratricopeptide repeat protein [Planctomycetota bacterium]|jgi:tetratricopeptide (TPR) repeat protein
MKKPAPILLALLLFAYTPLLGGDPPPEKPEAEETAVVFVRVIEGGTAEKAGIRSGDVLLSIAGRTVKIPGEVAKILKDLATEENKGKTFPVRIRRWVAEQKTEEKTLAMGLSRWGVQLQACPLSQLHEVMKSGYFLARMGGHFHKGWDHFRRGDLAKTVEVWQAGLALAESLNAGAWIATFSRNLGGALQRLGRYDDALAQWNRALEVDRKAGNAAGIVKTLGNMAVVLRRMGKSEDAYRSLKEAHRLCETLGDPGAEAIVLNRIGQTTFSMGRYEESRKAVERALDLARRAGNAESEIGALVNLAMVLRETGEIQKALTFVEKGLALAREKKLRFQEAGALRIRSGILRRFSRLREAHESLERALAIFRAMGHRSAEAFALGDLGLSHQDLGRPAKALETLAEALKRHQEIGNRPAEINVLNNIGGVHLSLGKPKRALQFHEKALVLAREIANPESEASSLELAGHCWEDLGQNLKALECQEKALAIRRRTGNRRGVSRNLTSLGQIYRLLGRESKALETLEAGLEIKLAIGDLHGEAVSLGTLGSVYLDLGLLAKALDCYEKARAALKRLGDTERETAVLCNIGSIRFLCGDVEGAEAILDPILERLKDAVDSPMKAAVFQHLGVIRNRRGRPAEALEAFERSIRISRAFGASAVNQRLDRAVTFKPGGRKPRPLAHRGRYLALAADFLSAFAEEKRGSGAEAAVSVWLPYAECILDVAWENASSSGGHEGKTRQIRIGSGEGFSSLPNATREALESSPFIGWTDLEAGFHILESFRAQTFLWKMRKSAADFEKDVDPALRKAREEAEGKMNSLRARLLASGTRSSGGGGSGEGEDRAKRFSALRAELEAVREEIDRIDRSMALADPAIGALRATVPVRLSRLQSMLQEDECFLEYVLTGQEGDRHRVRLRHGERTLEVNCRRHEAKPSGRAYLLAVTREKARVFLVGSTKALCDRVEIFRMILDAQRWCSVIEDFRREAFALYRDLLGPALAYCGGGGKAIRHLIISPDGPLSRLSFEALLTGEARDAKAFFELPYLARAVSTEYTPSATSWVFMREGKFRRGRPGSWFVALADPACGSESSVDPVHSQPSRKEAVGMWWAALLGPLPGTRREVSSVASLFQPGWTEKDAITSRRTGEGESGGEKSRVRVYLGSGARECVLRDETLLKKATLLHFACHGVADDLHPGDASVILSTGDLKPGEDGFFTAAEAMGIRTNARAVVLSACETGLGAIRRGEGVQGLTRSWQFAGARTVVVSLWKVDDAATAAFMTSFYKALQGAQDRTVTGALAAARREMASSPSCGAPVYWAAFTAHGER